MVINSQRFVASTGSKHDDPGPVCRGVVLIGCQLQQLNKAVDIIIIRCAVLVFDEYFELDADRLQAQQSRTLIITRMWANAQPDGRPAEHRWRPLFSAAKFGSRPLLDAVQ